mmetsp:Transcript_25649/g.38727  ORF Transcript_25649/g.38727 Transcript_25649/m.38727 type:complete len:146 (-) Transcript_25649:181-618(-)
MFLKALQCSETEVKAMLNLGHVYQTQAEQYAAGGNLQSAKEYALKAGDFLDSAKPLLDNLISNDLNDAENQRYAAQFSPLRLQCHRIMGSVFAGMKDFPSCEAEFRKATESFPRVKGAWEMLARILEVQGKTSEAEKAREQLNML